MSNSAQHGAGLPDLVGFWDIGARRC